MLQSRKLRLGWVKCAGPRAPPMRVQAPSPPLPACSVLSFSPGHALRSSPRPGWTQEALGLPGTPPSSWAGVWALSLWVPGVCKTSQGPAALLTSSCTELTIHRPSSTRPRGVPCVGNCQLVPEALPLGSWGTGTWDARCSCLLVPCLAWGGRPAAQCSPATEEGLRPQGPRLRGLADPLGVDGGPVG